MHWVVTWKKLLSCGLKIEIEPKQTRKGCRSGQHKATDCGFTCKSNYPKQYDLGIISP